MLELEDLEAAAADLEANADLDFMDLNRLSSVIHRLDGVRSRAAHRAVARGDHVLVGQSAPTWVAKQCQMSKNAASDRLCVGAQLEKMPRVAAALSSSEIGF